MFVSLASLVMGAGFVALRPDMDDGVGVGAATVVAPLPGAFRFFEWG